MNKTISLILEIIFLLTSIFANKPSQLVIDARSWENNYESPGIIGTDSPNFEMPPSGMLQLPWPSNETWRSTKGIHGTNSSGLDFNPYKLDWDADTSKMWVVPAADGEVVYVDRCWLRIKHQKVGGVIWYTDYVHVENIQVNTTTKKQVWKNKTQLGILANTLAEADCYGQDPTGPHVHFRLMRAEDADNNNIPDGNPVQVNIEGLSLSGWIIGKEKETNKTTFVKRDQKKYVWDYLDNTNCPTQALPKEIILFRGSNFDCGGKGENEGFKILPMPATGGYAITEIKMPVQSIMVGTCGDGVGQFDPFKQYKIQSVHTGLMLDVEGASQANGARVIQYDWHGGSNQRWKLEGENWPYSPYIYIKPVNGLGLSDGDLCLTGEANGAVFTKTCTSDEAQLWKVSPSGNDYTISNKFYPRFTTPKAVLDVPGGSSTRGLAIIIYPPKSSSNDNQLWRISDVMDAVIAIQDKNNTSKNTQLYASDPNLSDNNLDPNGSAYTVLIHRNYEECSSQSSALGKTGSSCIPGTQPNRAPNTPSLSKPENRSSTVNTAPTLCWQPRGDPDGHPVEYLVDILGGPINTHSGWSRSTCWNPVALNGHFGSYRWKVKARDSFRAESSWSETRIFTIESPNKPPSIDFQSANGSPAESILSRDTTWTFTGAASDPENDLRRIEFSCSGESCGAPTAHVNGGSWSHTQAGMTGANSVSFVAYDGFGNNSFSRTVRLLIDPAAPVTNIELTPKANDSGWRTTPVQIRLEARDIGSGSAQAGLDRMHYRLDSGAWQIAPDGKAQLTVDSDGYHVLDAYAVDKLGNREVTQTVNFSIDQAPPLPPSGALETGGVPHNSWQSAANLPEFTWEPGSDALSGYWGTQMYFGPDPAGIGYAGFPAENTRRWLPFTGGVRTGSYYLRGRSRDLAGNWSAWSDLFTFRYDGTPPENPANVVHALGVQSEVWQRITSAPAFSWPVPHDEGSGIQGYKVYWGLDESGASETTVSDPGYQAAAGLCPGSACTGYLRLRSVDRVGHLAGEWSLGFVMRFDDSPPTADFRVNGSDGQVSQTKIRLAIQADDLGSGVKMMRFSYDGVVWWPWQAFETQQEWTLPAVSRQSWPIYLQVQDGVGLVSAPVMHSVSLDVNTEQSKSANFRLYDHAQTGGAGPLNSPAFRGHGTLGQVGDTPPAASNNYRSWTGYEAGSQAEPLIVPGHDEFSHTTGAVVSGNGPTVMASFEYRMTGAVGEPLLPNNHPDLLSATFHHRPGFLASAPEQVLKVEPAPAEPPIPEAAPQCSIPVIQIDGDHPFTNQTDVELLLCAHRMVEMKISNSPDLLDAEWQPFADHVYWSLPTGEQEVQARFVYAAFRDADGAIYGTVMDDIILDLARPRGKLLLSDDIQVQETGVADETALGRRKPDRVIPALASGSVAPVNPDGSVNLMVDAADNNSGLVEMQFDLSPAFENTAWEPFAPVKVWLPRDEADGMKTIYARFRDSAGNVSAPSQISFLLDRQAPYGYLWASQRTIRPEAQQIGFELYATDDILEEETSEPVMIGSGVAEMRLGEQNDLSASVWQPVQESIAWPVNLQDRTENSLYVQFRDLAGNVSEVTSDTYHLDLAAPQFSVRVVSGAGLERTLEITGQDDLSRITRVYLSNDARMLEGVSAVEYDGSTVSWMFDEQGVVWIQAEDEAGNISQSLPIQMNDGLNLLNLYLPLLARP